MLVGKKTAQVASDKTREMLSKGDYDKTKVKGEGFFGSIAAGATNAAKTASVLWNLDYWRDTPVKGLKYGTVRDAMLDDGILDMFKTSVISNPLSKVNALVKKLLKRKILPLGREVKDADPIHHLIYQFLKSVGIRGYKWDNFKTDERALAGVAQSFLEYLGINVIPAWNDTELWMTRYFTTKTQDA